MVSTSRLRAPAGLQIDLYVDWDATAFFLSIQHNQKRLIFASTVRESDKTGRRLNRGITAFFLSRRLHAQPRETEREIYGGFISAAFLLSGPTTAHVVRSLSTVYAVTSYR